MPRIVTNPFVLGDVEIPGPVALAVLLAWKGGASSDTGRPILPPAPKRLKESLKHVMNYSICVGCYRITGVVEGGQIKSCCSACEGKSVDSDFWSKGRTYSNLLGDWASDKVVCKVIGTVIEFNEGKLNV